MAPGNVLSGARAESAARTASESVMKKNGIRFMAARNLALKGRDL